MEAVQKIEFRTVYDTDACRKCIYRKQYRIYGGIPNGKEQSDRLFSAGVLHGRYGKSNDRADAYTGISKYWWRHTDKPGGTFKESYFKPCTGIDSGSGRNRGDDTGKSLLLLYEI